MPKKDDKPHHKSEGVKLVGNPAALIDLLVKDEDLNKWVTKHIVNEGPKHKQVLTALLLKRLYALVVSIENSTDAVFTPQEGYELTTEKDGHGDVLPVRLPIHLGPGMDGGKVAEAVSKAPEQEALAYAMCLQVIEWAIMATSKTNALAEAELVGDGS